MNKPDNPPKEVDLYRDTLVRYLGYANELGESFRRQIGSKWVACSYGVATLYALADAGDKTIKTYNEYKEHPKHVAKSVYTAGDVLVWQMLASVLIPGFTINRICWLTHRILRKTTKLPGATKNMITTAAGVSAIPFIIHPIDHLVDRILDLTIRKFVP